MLCRAAAWFDANIIDGVVNLAATLTVFGSWLSGLFDNYVVDGLVNLASNITLDFGGRVRRCSRIDKRLPVRDPGRGDAHPAGTDHAAGSEPGKD